MRPETTSTFGAEIAAQCNRDELGRVAIFNGGYLQTLRAENQRVHRENVTSELSVGIFR